MSSVYDRVCQQALANRLELEKVFDPSSFGYPKGRKTADALAKIWREVGAGNEWIVDADLKDYFGSVDHEKLMVLLGKQIADSGVSKLIQQMLNTTVSNKCGRMSLCRNRPRRLREKLEWSGTLRSSPRRQNHR
jgi:RNA-directed DNA polymerase